MKKIILLLFLFEACTTVSENDYMNITNSEKALFKSKKKKIELEEKKMEEIGGYVRAMSNIHEIENKKGNDVQKALKEFTDLSHKRYQEFLSISRDTENTLCICNNHPGEKLDCTQILLKILRHTGFEWRQIAFQNKNKLRNEVMNYYFLDCRYSYYEEGKNEHLPVRRFFSKFISRDEKEQDVDLRFYSKSGSRDPKYYRFFDYFERKKIKEHNGVLIDLFYSDHFFSFTAYKVEKIIYYATNGHFYVEIRNKKNGDICIYRNELDRKITQDKWVSDALQKVITSINEETKRHNEQDSTKLNSPYDNMLRKFKKKLPPDVKPPREILFPEDKSGDTSPDLMDRILAEYDIIFDEAAKGKKISQTRKTIYKHIGKIVIIILITAGSSVLAGVLA